jgi:hypothetical protein
LDNPAFYFAVGLFSLTLILSIAVIPVNSYLLNNRILTLVRNDSKFFDEEEMTLGEYFNLEKKAHNQDNLENMNKNIEFVLNPAKMNDIPRGENINVSDRAFQPEKVGIPKYGTVLGDQNPNFTIKNQNKSKVDDNIRNYIEFKENCSNITMIPEDKIEISSPIKLITLDPLEDIKLFSNRKYIYYKDPNHFYTIKDYEDLSPYEAPLYDRRPFYILFWDMLKDEHVIINLIFKQSLIDPLWQRIIYFIFNLSVIFAMNALFFSDDLIDLRANFPPVF